MIEHVEARSGSYADSVTLMQVSRQVNAVAGVDAALVAMGTPLNLDLARSMGFDAPAHVATDDLLIAVRARDESTLAAALTAAADALAARPVSAGAAPGVAAPRTVGSAARDDAGLALISVPGQHAFTEAMDALDAGCDVMIFSDNVPIEQEIRLKEVGAERGLLVLGPDCGTAVIAGVGLGFSHSVEPGPVGIVAASGTGCQQLLCLLDAAGVGVSAALGVGGRDLSAQVGGRSTIAALAALDADPRTELIVVVSKPPAAEVARSIRELASTRETQVQLAFVGEGQDDLTAAAEAAIRALGTQVPQWPSWPGRPTPPRQGDLRGLFAGGTLCDEAMVIAAERLGAVYSNIAPRPEWRIAPTPRRPGHVLLDFGDDELTAGRPHPMIDQSLRLERLADEAADPRTAAILLDVVLGHGAHPDPAGELAPVIAAAGPPVVVSLIAAKADPQDLHAQAGLLRQAGAHVFTSNAQAARFACELIS
jgi:FdrA protein